jgi:carbamoyltransferase
MKVLGIHGGYDLPRDTAHGRFNKDIHDSSAALLIDGETVGVYEEERFDRIKHSNKFPINSIRHCLNTARIELSEIDRISIVNREETHAWQAMWVHFTQRQNERFRTHREWILHHLETAFDVRLDPTRLSFVGHHRAHAMGGFAWSGFERALVVSLDGGGDQESGTISVAEKGKGMRLIRSYAIDQQSLGVFYQRISFYLGFRPFSEFKVMGLAPYGDASVYRRYFDASYVIKPNGDYQVDYAKLFPLMALVRPRRPGDPIEQMHKDIAASVQEMLEKIVFSILRYYRLNTGETNLVLTGGLGHNCALNGKLAYSGLFERLYVQPAAHDGGTALGAALEATVSEYPDKAKLGAVPHVFTGRRIDARDASLHLSRWKDFLEISKVSNRVERAASVASMIASGEVIGLAHGASEFGPRALGHRSIIADPRPAAIKDLVNEMVKKREGFRPFAPVVLEEEFDVYFERPVAEIDLRFMTYAVRVRPKYQCDLGAVTHVDGTARVQTVGHTEADAELRQIIEAFRAVSGFPILLNTSFNNNAEPIVDSAEDAIVCFLTTGLDALVLDEYLITKKPSKGERNLSLVPTIPEWVTLEQTTEVSEDGERTHVHTLGPQDSMPAAWEVSRPVISSQLYQMLAMSNGAKSVHDLATELGLSCGAHSAALSDELFSLWQARLIKLFPASTF